MAFGDELPGVVPIRGKKNDTNVKDGGEVWKIVCVLANHFSFKEWSAQEPASLDAFSIGEEQSASAVAAIAWSPSGFAKHRRCVLTVLTSNLLLSLWDQGPDPSEALSWSRTTIINEYLQAYFNFDDASPDLVRKRRRIRTMCWAKELPKDVQAVQAYGELIAVLNDNHEIIVVSVSSPYICKQEGWSAEVLSHSSIITNSQNRHSSDHEIMWSSWATKSDTVDALLSCKTGGDHNIFKFSIKSSVTHDIQVDDRGTVPRVFMKPVDETSFPDLAGPKFSMLCDSKNYLSNPSWDVISGRCCFQEFFCITTHLSQMETFRVHTQSGATGASTQTLRKTNKLWNLQMRQSDFRLQFAKEHNLGRMTTIKTWGLASLGAYIAACVTVHPSTMVEYSMASTERSTILFGHASSLRDQGKDKNENENEDEDEDEDENLFFPWESEPQLRDSLAAHAAPWSMILGGTTSPVLSRSILSCRLLYSSFCVRLMLGSVEHTTKALIIAALRSLEKSLNTSLATEIESLDSIEIASGEFMKIVDQVNSFVKTRSTLEAEIPANQRLLEYYRCALSYMTIQEPGISKFCSTCGREYCNEQQVLQNDVDAMPVLDVTGNGDDAENGVPSRDNEDSLISALFRSQGICIFCDGKFIG
ncbi:hypothetical protein MMC26_004017 [Xylographa opegraphella]|nr:hypothetical protein [Xylographa opegraphella]